MKYFRRVLYLTHPEYYLRKDGENIVITLHDKKIKTFPIHLFLQIVCFNYMGVSPDLMKLCMEQNIPIAFFTPYGKYCGRVVGKTYGNIHIRKRQYALANSPESLEFVRNIIYAKAYNARKVLIRGKLDHKNSLDTARLIEAIDTIKKNMFHVRQAVNKDTIRGFEGNIARKYFSVLDALITKQKSDFYMRERTKRPPLDRFNALLSFMYSMYTNRISGALEGFGIDPYVGFFHTDRAGRVSMALDMIEEFRAIIIDKFCLSLVNHGKINKKHFTIKENNATLLNEKGREIVLQNFNEKENQEIYHHYLEQKVPIALLPQVQAQLLNAYLRQDIDAYPPYMAKE